MDSPEVPVANGWWPVGAILSAKPTPIGIDSRQKRAFYANDTFLFSSVEHVGHRKPPNSHRFPLLIHF